jgi:two-component system LytT family sensor kinase
LPLVENAIKHGIQESLTGGTLYFKIQQQEQYLWIRVRNPIETHKPVEGMGMGLEILRKRLAAEYENQHKLKIDHDDKMFTVDLKIPQK